MRGCCNEFPAFVLYYGVGIVVVLLLSTTQEIDAFGTNTVGPRRSLGRAHTFSLGHLNIYNKNNNDSNNSNNRIFGGQGGGGRGGGNGGNRHCCNHDGLEDGDGQHHHQQQQSLPWMLLGSTFLAQKALEARSALTVSSTVVPTAASSSDSSWKLVLSVLLVVVQSLGLNAVHLVQTAARQSAAWYLTQLATHPLVTKAITAGVVGFFGDYLAQWLEFKMGRRRPRIVEALSEDETTLSSSTSKFSLWRHQFLIHGTYDFRRGLGILLDGILVSGPLMHLGYDIFERIIPTTPSASGRGQSLAAISHVLADSVLLDSIFIASTYIVTGLMEGIKTDVLIPQFQNDYVPALKASWATSLTLVPLEFACFRYLPVPLRPLAMNLNDVVWDAVISFMSHRSRHSHVLV